MGKQTAKKDLKRFYDHLYKAFGAQAWWPAKTRFEVVVGAILTQNTNWTNVEKAIKNLKAEGALTIKAMHALSEDRLATLIRPSGYFNVKARRLKAFLSWLHESYSGSLDRLFKVAELREELLSVNGIGPETADSIILYGAKRPVFVIDAYTKRILTRHGLASDDASYAEMQKLFMDNMAHDEKVFNEYHALIVRVSKEYCKSKNPLCSECPLGDYL
ncbi:MAG: endonuclease III domain-containing protein [Deltaproteobacteria bacterium]|nr:endonuclease III domain-containing protein [Deltaproteobacteria bacterium]